jgi:hypothetical protein
MPRSNQAKHKELLDNMGVVQEKLEDLADLSYINDEALRVLSNTNMELYNKLKKMFADIENVKNVYTNTIYESRWSQQYLDPNYQRKSAKKKEHKINDPWYKKCSCGDWISIREDRFWGNHQKTEKHKSSLLRIDIQKNINRLSENLDIKNFEGKAIKPILNIKYLDKLMILNYKIANSVEDKLRQQKKFKMSIYDWVECYIKRRKIRQLYNKYDIPLQ